MTTPDAATVPAHPRPTKEKAKSFFGIVKETASDWMQDNAMRLSAALALYTILSLAPLLILALKIISIVWRNAADAQAKFYTQIQNLMGGAAAEAIDSMLKNGSKHGNGLLATVIGTALLFFSATGVFVELQDSMNTIWGVKPKPNQGIWGFIRNRLLSLGMVFGIAFLLLVSMFVSTMLTSVTQAVLGNAKWLGMLADVAVSLGVVALLFAGIFKFLPDVKLEWRHVWLGAALTAGLFIVGKYGLALYFKYGTPQSAFGAAGSLAAVLLWVYYSSFILFFGAEFTKVWALHHGHTVVPDPHAVKITEEDRAQRGIPSEKRMSEALDSQPRTGVTPSDPAFGSKSYFLAAAAFVSGWGARYFMDRSDRDVRTFVAGTRLDTRLRNLEKKVQTAPKKAQRVG